jgi:prepilin-type N-terminal cleavage/methylation domain-containing protein
MFSPSINGRIDLRAQCPQARSHEHRTLQWQLFRALCAPSLKDLSRRNRAKDRRSAKISKHCCAAFTLPTQRDPESVRGFTLLELLIVVGIIGLLLVLMAPAFTYIKGGTDVTSAAYTIKGVLDTARTYAKTNNTYTWIGFYEEDVSQPSVIPAPDPLCPGCVGRLVMSIVASKDGTYIYDPDATGTENFIDPTRLTQVGKLIKIDNIHLPLFELGTGSGDTFDARPSPTPRTDAPLSRFGELNSSPTAPTTNTKFPFQYPVGDPAPARQYRFRRTLRFSPTGECRINSTYDVRTIVEVGLLQTHGSVTPPPRSGGGTSFVTWDGNVAAVQITGFGGNVKIYRR